jgi:hypothetical protein
VSDAGPLPSGPDSTRVDRWLWAVRLTKTRSDAAQACRGGHVRVNDRPAKPASPVKVGDETVFSGFIGDIRGRKQAQVELERALEVERKAVAPDEDPLPGLPLRGPEPPRPRLAVMSWSPLLAVSAFEC